MFKVYGEKENEKEPVFLKLIQAGTIGDVDVVVVDADGKPHPSGNLVRFTKSGFLKRHGGVSNELGIKHTHENMIEWE